MAETGSWIHPAISEWEARGSFLEVESHRLFVVDAGPEEEPLAEPLLVLHGFPTSSFDFAHLAPALARHRRVVLPDMLGYGLSDKPNVRYSIAGQADLVIVLCGELGLERFALLTHDMGDTVGGELLARQMEGSWPVEITRRVLTNGSIYIAMAQLTDGQKLLLSLPDETIDGDLAPSAEMISASLVATLAPSHRDVDMSPHGELVAHQGGNRMLARTIRYIEDRRANEARYTGAIEHHPSTLTVVWGPEDPIAVAVMVDHLRDARADAIIEWIDGAGHYPQIEEPASYLAALVRALGPAA